MDYYKYFDSFKEKIAPKNLAIVKYDELVANPKQTIETVYEQFDMDINAEYAKKLVAVSQKQKKYKSTHSYSLEDYGMTEQQVYDELEPIFEKYGFAQLQD